VVSDRYGRKWPLVLNLLIIATLELGVSFVQTFHQFLALRAMFGVAMGGIWGLAAATALENLPVELRGLASGIVQQGYAVGYLIAAVIRLTLVPRVSGGWRAMFWCSMGFSTSAALLRAVLPESAVFLRAKQLEKEHGPSHTNKTKVFVQETKHMLATHWLLCIYAVILMAGELHPKFGYRVRD
jgi:SHS family lactate transporter-like MFS transporter